MSLAGHFPGVDWLTCLDDRLIATAIDMLATQEDDDE